MAQAPLPQLRWGEDAYVDDLLRGPCQRAGVPLLAQPYPRSYIDVNREPDDLDQVRLDEQTIGLGLGLALTLTEEQGDEE